MLISILSITGILLTCKTGALSGDKAKGVDKEFVGLFTVLDENESWLLDKNIQTYCSDPAGVVKDNEDFMESNKMHAINGYFYGNVLDLNMCLGDTVRWHLAGIGNEVDLHTGELARLILHHNKQMNGCSVRCSAVQRSAVQCTAAAVSAAHPNAMTLVKLSQIYRIALLIILAKGEGRKGKVES